MTRVMIPITLSGVCKVERCGMDKHQLRVTCGLPFVRRVAQAIAVVQPAMRRDPALVMEDLGFGPLVLVSQFPVKMAGSGSSFTAYVFGKPGVAVNMVRELWTNHPCVECLLFRCTCQMVW